MAKTDEGESPTHEAKIIGKGEFTKLLKKLSAAEARASEAKGEMGSAVENAIAKHNVHKDALRVIRKYIKKDPTAAVEFKAHLDAYWEHAELGDPEEDLVEDTPTRRSRMKKPDIDAEKEGIRDGKVVALAAAE